MGNPAQDGREVGGLFSVFPSGTVLIGWRLRGGLAVGRLDAGQEFTLGLRTAIDIHGNESVGEKQVQGLRVYCFQCAVSGIIQSEHVSPSSERRRGASPIVAPSSNTIPAVVIRFVNTTKSLSSQA